MGSRTLCLLSSANNFWIYVPNWASLSITLRRSTSKMSSLSYWIRRYTVPTLASAKEALEELEGFVSVESLRCFWILLKASTGFFLLMAKISSWKWSVRGRILDDGFWIPSDNSRLVFPLRFKIIDTRFGWLFIHHLKALFNLWIVLGQVVMNKG